MFQIESKINTIVINGTEIIALTPIDDLTDDFSIGDEFPVKIGQRNCTVCFC